MKPAPFATFVRPYSFELTPAQRAVARVCFDGEEPSAVEDDAGEHAAVLFGGAGDSEEIPAIARRVIAWKKGARVGGSRMAAMRLYQLGHTVPLSLAPGESASGIIVAPDVRLARQTFGYVLGAAREDKAARRIVLASEKVDSLTFVRRHDGQRVTLECLPATAGGSAVRGRTLVGAVMSEASFFRDDNAVVNDAEVYRALAPRIVRGGQLIIESTAWTSLGLLHELFRANYGDPSSALACLMPTLVMRPDDETRAYVEAERQRDPDNAAREFDAQELPAGSDVFFDAHAIDAQMVDRLPDVSGATRFAFGGDLGLTTDSSVLAGVAVLPDESMVLVELEERRPKPGQPLRLSEVIAHFAKILHRYRVTSFIADGWSREAAREHAAKHGITIVAAPEGASGKLSTYTTTKTALSEKRLVMPTNPRLRAQLRSIVGKPVAGGGVRITSPRRSGHGDLVSALVLAVAAATRRITIAQRLVDAQRGIYHPPTSRMGRAMAGLSTAHIDEQARQIWPRTQAGVSFFDRHDKKGPR